MSDENTLVKDVDTGVWMDPDSREPIWRTENGRNMRIREMETRHIRNCMAMIFLRASGWRTGYLDLFAEELKRRGNSDD